MCGDADFVDHIGDGVPQSVHPEVRRRGPLENTVHPLHQGGGLTGLGQIVAHAQLLRVRQGLMPAEGGDDDGLGAAIHLLRRLEKPQPVQPRQGHIRQQKVRLPLLDQPQGFQSVPSGSRHGKLTGLLDGLLQHGAEFLAGVRQNYSPLMFHDDSKPFLLVLAVSAF